MVLYCFKCHSEVVFDAEHIGKNGRKIPLDPTTRRPHDCPERDKPTVERGNPWAGQDKNDHGNEQEVSTGGIDFKALAEKSKTSEDKFVDHTAKAQLRLKTITDPTPEGMDVKYNKLAAEYNVKFSQYHPLGSLYTIAVYYEEMK
jgi:hypothetical protein